MEEALIALLITDSLVSTVPDIAANVLRWHLVDKIILATEIKPAYNRFI